MSMPITFGASQLIISEQVITCLAHSKEYFQPNLADYWCVCVCVGGGGGGGRSSYFSDRK